MSFSASVIELVSSSDDPLVSCASNWPRVQLSEVAKVINGFPLKSEFFVEKSGTPVIRIRDVTAGYATTFYKGPIPEGYWVKKGDIVIGMDGDFAARIWEAEQALLNQRVCKLDIDTSKIDKRFLAYVLPGYLNLINASTHSVTVKHLSSKTIGQIPLPFPSLPEQKRIVSKLDSLFARSTKVRDELAHIPRLIERYKQAILSAAFRGDLTADWRAKHNKKKSDLQELASEALSFNYGSSTKSSQTGDVPVLRMGNIQDGILDWDNLVFTSDKEEISKYALKKGDVLFNRTNSPELVGKTALYNGERPAIFAGYLIRIKCSDKMLPEYLTYCLNSPEGREYCWQVKSDGVSQSNINAKKVAAFMLRIPCIDEQKEAVRLIAAAFRKISVISTETGNASKLLETCDGAVLAKAFSGKLVSQDPNDEPADALLARIQSQAVTAPAAKHKKK